MVHAQFTREQLDEMVAISLEKYRIQEGYDAKDVKWSELINRMGNRLKKSFNGEEIQANPNNKGKRLSDYRKDNFKQDKGYGLKKFGRQIKRGAQVATAVGVMVPGEPIAKAAGKATRAIKSIPDAAKGALKRFIGEAAELNFEVPKEYTHFAMRKSDGKIVNGWDYSEFDPEDLRRFPKDYFIDDLVDMGLNTKLFKIATVRACKGMGIDPFDCKNWDNPAEGDWVDESCDRNKKNVNEGVENNSYFGLNGLTVAHNDYYKIDCVYYKGKYLEHEHSLTKYLWEEYVAYCKSSSNSEYGKTHYPFCVGGTTPSDEGFKKFVKGCGLKWVLAKVKAMNEDW